MKAAHGRTMHLRCPPIPCPVALFIQSSLRSRFVRSKARVFTPPRPVGYLKQDDGQRQNPAGSFRQGSVAIRTDAARSYRASFLGVEIVEVAAVNNRIGAIGEAHSCGRKIFRCHDGERRAARVTDIRERAAAWIGTPGLSVSHQGPTALACPRSLSGCGWKSRHSATCGRPKGATKSPAPPAMIAVAGFLCFVRATRDACRAGGLVPCPISGPLPCRSHASRAAGVVATASRACSRSMATRPCRCCSGSWQTARSMMPQTSSIAQGALCRAALSARDWPCDAPQIAARFALRYSRGRR